MSSFEVHPAPAAEAADQRIGAAIRARRDALKMSQAQLAEAVGLNAAQSISAIEKGERSVRAAELVRIARALHIDSSELLTGQHDASPRVLWRCGSKNRNRVREARLLERARRYAQLERWCNEKAEGTLPNYDFDPLTATPKDAQHLAERTRKDLELGPYPARTIRDRLEEDFGVKVFYEELSEEDRVDGSAACVRDRAFGAAVLMSASEVSWRQTFSFAHELFHLVTWTSVDQAWQASVSSPDEDPSWHEALEARANDFASALLMPTESFTARFDAKVRGNKFAVADIAQLAVEFGVSTQAVTIRLSTLGRIDKKVKEQLYKNAALPELARSLRPEPEQSKRGPLPPRFEQLARTAYLRREVGKSLLATYLEKHVADLSDFCISSADAEATLTVA